MANVEPDFIQPDSSDYPELVWREINAQRPMGAEFANGIIDFNFSIGGVNAMVPNMTYTDIKYTLTAKDYDDTSSLGKPTKLSVTTFAQDSCACLFNSSQFLVGGSLVSNVQSFHAQTDIMQKRLGLTGAQLYSVASGASNMEPNFQKRCNQINLSSSNDSELEVVPLADLRLAVAETNISPAGLLSGINTVFTRLKVGDYIVINGSKYELLTITSDTVATIDYANSSSISGAVCSHGLKRANGEGNNVMSAVYVPPLGIFASDELLGAGDYRLSFQPNSMYKKAFVESKIPNAVEGVDYDLVIDSFRLYVATTKVRVPETSQKTLILKECAVYSKKIDSTQANLDFTIPATTTMIAVSIQGQDAGSNPINSPTKFRSTANTQDNLTSLQLTYAGLSKPSTQWGSVYDEATGVNRTQQRYMETMLENQLAFSPGATEKFGDWHDSPYYAFSFNKDMNDRSTQLQAQINLSALADNCNLIVSCFYDNTINITTEKGVVTQVRKLLS